MIFPMRILFHYSSIYNNSSTIILHPNQPSPSRVERRQVSHGSKHRVFSLSSDSDSRNHSRLQFSEKGVSCSAWLRFVAGRARIALVLLVAGIFRSWIDCFGYRGLCHESPVLFVQIIHGVSSKYQSQGFLVRVGITADDVYPF